MSGKVHVMDHPLVAHKLTILRDKDTSVKDFREIVSEIGMLITYEATRDLPLTTKEVETPICRTIAPTLKGKKFAVVPILRAGLGLVDGVLRMVPSARVGHIGMFRDEETLEPHVYFCKMPKDIAERDIMIVDPMLATGGSAEAAITEMKKRGCKNIKLMVLLAAPEGVERIQKAHPDVAMPVTGSSGQNKALSLYVCDARQAGPVRRKGAYHGPRADERQTARPQPGHDGDLSGTDSRCRTGHCPHGEIQDRGGRDTPGGPVGGWRGHGREHHSAFPRGDGEAVGAG